MARPKLLQRMAYGESDNLMWWRNAERKHLQVKILAELNGCSVEHMREWLLSHGVAEEEMLKPSEKKRLHVKQEQLPAKQEAG